MLSLASSVVNFGAQIGWFEFCVPARRCLSLRRRSTLAHKVDNSMFVCHAGAVSHFGGGQFWHTKWIIQGLCASPALSLASSVVNFGTQSGKFEVCVPARRCRRQIRRRKMRNSWHTNRLKRRSCATPHQSTEKNEKTVAHKPPKIEFVCHSSPIPKIK